MGAAALLSCAALAGCGGEAVSAGTHSVDLIVVSSAQSSASSSGEVSSSVPSAVPSSAQSAVSSSAQSAVSTASVSQPESSAPVISEPGSSAAELSEPEISEPEISEPDPPEPDPPQPTGGWQLPLNDEFDADFYKNTLFIGDSIYTGLYLYEHLPRELVAAKIGYTAYSAQTQPFDENYYAGSAVDYAKKRDPERIIVMLGSNSLSAWTDFDDFETGYRGLLNKLKEVCPNAGITAVSVPPITADSSLAASYSHVTNPIIDTANLRIRSLCEELGHSYFDLNSRLKDANGYFRYDLAEMDGLHFMGYTYKIMLGELEDQLKQQLDTETDQD